MISATQYQDWVLARVRSVLPEVLDVQTMLRVLRLSGQGVPMGNNIPGENPFWQMGQQSWLQYALDTEVFRTRREIDWNANIDREPMSDFYLIRPEQVAWDTNPPSGRLTPLEKWLQPPLLTELRTGTPEAWYIEGGSLGLYPVPSSQGLLVVEGFFMPYLDGTTKEIHGIRIEDLPMVAQHHASFFIESLQPQLAYTWRQEARAHFLRVREEQAWARFKAQQEYVVGRTTRVNKRWLSRYRR